MNTLISIGLVSSVIVSLSSAETLHCEQYFGFSIDTSCRITSGSVADDEILEISNANPNITLLTFSNVNFNSIPRDLFVKFPNVEMLFISQNNMNQISTIDFRNCNQLTKFFINRNQLEIIESQVFELCERLTSLSIFDNPITVIKQNALSGLSNLEIFSITNLPLKDFDSSILAYVPKLRELKIVNCSLTFISKIFCKFNLNLTTIDLQRNQIEAIEDGTFEHLTKLDRIILDFNNLKALLSVNAVTLSAQFNKLQRFHISSATHYLSINDNFITTLTCDEILNIRSMDASNNSLSNIPCVSRMTNAFALYLRKNNLRKMKRTIFRNIANISTLEIHNNPRLRLGSKMLNSMKILSTLKIDRIANGYRTLKTDLPNLYLIWLTTKNWNCTKLIRIANTLNSQKIYMNFNNREEFSNFKCKLQNWEVSMFS